MVRVPLLQRLLRQEAQPGQAQSGQAQSGQAQSGQAQSGQAQSGEAQPAEAVATPLRRRRPAPPASELRRERRALLRLREQKLRDLGGLSLEMYRRDRFREDLLLERCAELIGLEARVHELDILLGAVRPSSAAPRTARCNCGAPLLWGSRFCPSCGRPVAAGSAGTAR